MTHICGDERIRVGWCCCFYWFSGNLILLADYYQIKVAVIVAVMVGWNSGERVIVMLIFLDCMSKSVKIECQGCRLGVGCYKQYIVNIDSVYIFIMSIM